MTTEAAGARLRTFPQTLSLGNWPFLALLGFFALLPIFIGFQTGDVRAGLLIGGGVAVVPAIFFVVQLLANVFGTRVLAMHEGGLLVSRRRRQELVPYSRVRAVELRREVVRSRGVAISQLVVRLGLDDDSTLTIWAASEQAEVALELAERANVQVATLG